MGFRDQAIPVQVNEKTVFPPPTTAFPSPSFLDLMKIKSTEDVDRLTHNSQTNKRKHKAFCILPLFLTQCLYLESNNSKETLVQMVQAIANRSILSLAEDKTDNQGEEIESIEDPDKEDSTYPQENSTKKQLMKNIHSRTHLGKPKKFFTKFSCSYGQWSTRMTNYNP